MDSEDDPVNRDNETLSKCSWNVKMETVKILLWAPDLFSLCIIFIVQFLWGQEQGPVSSSSSICKSNQLWFQLDWKIYWLRGRKVIGGAYIPPPVYIATTHVGFVRFLGRVWRSGLMWAWKAPKFKLGPCLWAIVSLSVGGAVYVLVFLSSSCLLCLPSVCESWQDPSLTHRGLLSFHRWGTYFLTLYCKIHV